MRRLTSSVSAVPCFARGLSHHSDYFELLGAKRDVTIDLDALKKNYHQYQSQHHPDLHPEVSASTSSSSTRTADQLKDATAYAASAYSVLKDPFQRCRYLRLLLEADSRAVMAGDKALLPTGKDYYQLAVAHDASEAQKDNTGKKSVSDTVRSEDHDANPVNHDQEFLMEMMELNMKLSEALELEHESAARNTALDELKTTVSKLEEGYAAECETLYSRITRLRNEAIGIESGAMGQAASADVYSVAKSQFRDLVLKWTFASNLRRQINEGY